jgi:Spy/CpxP family protein refolding chaperone
MKSLHMLSITTLALMLAGPVLAGPEYAGHGRGDRGVSHFDGDPSDSVLHMTMRAVHQLDLSDEQKEAVHAILKDTRKDLQAVGEAGSDNRQALHEALTAETLDEDALAKAATGAGDLVAERIVIAAHAARAVMAELTEEQRAELQLMREEHMAKLHEKRQSREDS